MFLEAFTIFLCFIAYVLSLILGAKIIFELLENHDTVATITATLIISVVVFLSIGAIWELISECGI